MSGEKTEKPTDKKLNDARKKGQVAQSQDINKLFVTAAGFETLFALQDVILEKIQSIFIITIASLDDPFIFALKQLFKQLLSIGMSISFMVIAAVVVFRILASNVQFGFLMAPSSLAPSLNKLNPVSNIKNTFSVKKIIELLTNIAKALVLSFVFYSVIKNSLADIVFMGFGNLSFSIDVGIDLFVFAARLSLLIFGVLAIIDFLVQKHFFIKGQKMSKDDIFREYKQAEGDPQMKGERKAVARELAQSGPAPVANTDEATAVVVNPTHFAVALRYVPGETPLPKLLCKGVDDRAQEIIKRAKDKDIPVIRYVWLARTLFSKGKENRYIPRDVIKPMAAVFRVIKEIEASCDEKSYDQIHMPKEMPEIRHEDVDV